MTPNEKLQKQFADLSATMHQAVQQMQQSSRPADEIILDDVELCERLHVSKRTTATWRECRLIKFSLIRGKIYYIYADVLAFVKKHSVATLDGTLKIKLQRNSN